MWYVIEVFFCGFGCYVKGDKTYMTHVPYFTGAGHPATTYPANAKKMRL